MQIIIDAETLFEGAFEGSNAAPPEWINVPSISKRRRRFAIADCRLRLEIGLAFL